MSRGLQKGRITRFTVVLFIAVAVAAGSASVASVRASGAASGPYVIGMSNDLSGPISALGQPGLAGLKTYVDYLNANGGVNGRKIDLVSLDDQSNPALGRTDYTELAQKKALVMLGCVYTAVCQAAEPLVGQYKVPIIAEGGADSDLFPAKPYFYSNDLAQGLQPVVMADEIAAMAKAKGIKKVRLAWIGANTSADLDGVKTLRAIVKTHPGWSLVTVQLLPLAVTNPSSQVQAVASAKPNFIIGVHNDSNIIPVVKGLRTAGVTAPLINVTAGSADSTFQALKGNFVAWRTYVSPTETNIPAVVAMRTRAAKYGQLKQATGSYFTQGYVAGMLVQAALKECGAGCSTGEQFNTALQKLTSFNSQGLSAGALGFSPTRHVLNQAAWFYGWSASKGKPARVSGAVTVSAAQIKQFG